MHLDYGTHSFPGFGQSAWWDVGSDTQGVMWQGQGHVVSIPDGWETQTKPQMKRKGGARLPVNI